MSRESRDRVYEIIRWKPWEKQGFLLGYSVARTQKQALENYATDNGLNKFQRRGLRVHRARFEGHLLFTDYRGVIFEV